MIFEITIIKTIIKTILIFKTSFETIFKKIFKITSALANLKTNVTKFSNVLKKANFFRKRKML